MKNWSEALPSAPPRKARHLGSSRESSQARAWVSKLRYDRTTLKMALWSSTALCPKELTLALRLLVFNDGARLIGVTVVVVVVVVVVHSRASTASGGFRRTRTFQLSSRPCV